MPIIYSKALGLRDAEIGRLETPIKMVIEHESDLLTKQGGVRDWLFNVEKSDRFGETILGHNEFNVFRATEEGAAAETDSLYQTYSKFIEHIQFMKEFIISAEMMEDANYGVAADAKRRAENFTRAYYKTQHKICSYALANGTNTSGTFAGATLDLTTPDGKPLFAIDHTYGLGGVNMQSNYFCGDIFSSSEKFEEALSGFGAAEKKPVLDGRYMSIVISPVKQDKK